MTFRIALFALAFALPLAACGDADDPVVMDEDTITVETPDVDGAMEEAEADLEAAGMEAEAAMDEAAMETEAAMEEGAAEMEAAGEEMEAELEGEE